jgi:hypothetical protein
VVDEVGERKDNIEKRRKSGNEEKNDQQSKKLLKNKEMYMEEGYTVREEVR